MELNNKRIFFKVHGFVQGVGYRAFVKEIADKYNIKGFVRNAFDGGVEVLAEGNEENIKKFMDEINVVKRGRIEVVGIEIDSNTLNNYSKLHFDDFSIKEY